MGTTIVQSFYGGCSLCRYGTCSCYYQIGWVRSSMRLPGQLHYSFVAKVGSNSFCENGKGK